MVDQESACRNLWASVVSLAVADLGKRPLPSGNLLEEAWSACQFLLSGEQDEFISYSGLDPEAMRGALLDLAIDGKSHWRAARRSLSTYVAKGGDVAPDARKRAEGLVSYAASA